MFGTKENKKDQPMQSKSSSSSSSSNSSNSLVGGTHLEGTVKADNDFRIDGTLKGNLICKGKVIIGPSGFVDGEIDCTNALIEGKFNGVLKVKELLSVKDNAKITGEIVTDKLVVQSGAIFNVKCQMGGQTLSNVSSKNKPDSQHGGVKKDLVLNA
ncbi:bactofilin family protein [Portibacter marinus]|uniref:bactofilin family protein n=1 Tax=Portibacter marinus TaxID=2898660 RepID=UPI001F4034B2|nr:polymer-forming cytoskeletal protein [Portibacter marinus]